MSDDIDADREALPEAHHEASEISYDEQFYPARPRAAAAPGPAAAVPAADRRAQRALVRRQRGVREVARRAVDAGRRQAVRHPVLRPGQHVAEPVRQPRPAGGDREGLGLVHRLPDLHDHQAGHHVPGHARRRGPVGGVRADRHRRRPHRPGEEGRRHPRLGADPQRRRPLRPDQHLDRRRVRHRGRVPDHVRGRGRPRRRGDRRHRPGPHRQGRRLPAGRDEGRRLPGHLPHGRDPREGLAPAARRCAGAGTRSTWTPRPRTSWPSTATSSAGCSG